MAYIDTTRVWPYSQSMATVMIRSTYSIDLQTASALENIARRWKVSKSEALRRAIRAAAEKETLDNSDATKVLDTLQRSLGLNSTTARRWERRVGAERKAATRQQKI